LLDHRVVINYVSEAVFGDVGEADEDDCFRIEKANKFVGLGAFPQQAIRAIFSRAIRERLSVNIQIEGGRSVGLGDG
jgi:hypothetical protein